MRDAGKGLVVTTLDATATACAPGVLAIADAPVLALACVGAVAGCILGQRIARAAWAEVDSNRLLAVEWLAAFVAVSAVLGAAVASEIFYGEFYAPLLALPVATAGIRLGAESSVRRAVIELGPRAADAVRSAAPRVVRRVVIASCALIALVALAITVLEMVIEPREILVAALERVEGGSDEGCFTTEDYDSWWVAGTVDEQRLAAAKATCRELRESELAEHDRRQTVEAKKAAFRAEFEAAKAAWRATDWPSAVLRIASKANGPDAPVTPAQFYAAWVGATSLQKGQIADALSELHLVWAAEVEDVAESHRYSRLQFRRDGWTLRAKAECSPDYEREGSIVLGEAAPPVPPPGAPSKPQTSEMLDDPSLEFFLRREEPCMAYVECRFPETASVGLAGVAKGESIQSEGKFERASLGDGVLRVQFSECGLL